MQLHLNIIFSLTIKKVKKSPLLCYHKVLITETTNYIKRNIGTVILWFVICNPAIYGIKNILPYLIHYIHK